jgi:small-conductance mechanosensitive channel
MASSIQREALKRIYSAFNQAGIEFASNAVTVRRGSHTEAAAAAATASTQPISVPAA